VIIVRGVIVAVLLVLALCVETMGGPLDFRRRRAARKESREAKVRRKLESIVIPKIEFRQADIRDILELLAQLSAELDPDKEGVNIILNLHVPGKKRPKREEHFMEKSDEKRTTSPWDVPVTFTARTLSLAETLNVVSQMGGLKYRVEGNTVMVVPVDAPAGPIIRRWYHVKPAITDKVKEKQEQK